MNLYVESEGLLRFRKELTAFTKKQNDIGVTLLVNRRIHKYVCLNFLMRRLKIFPDLEIPVTMLGRREIRLARKRRFRLTVRVNRPLRARDKRMLLSFAETIVIRDETGLWENESFYAQANRFRYRMPNGGNEEEAEAFDLCAFSRSDGCRRTSCLGKTLYLSRDGRLSFCPERPKETELCRLDEVKDPDGIWENMTFAATLGKSIEKRKKCALECEWFGKCRGGCPLEDEDCKAFAQRMRQAEKRREEIKKEQPDLTTLPSWERESLLKETAHYPQ